MEDGLKKEQRDLIIAAIAKRPNVTRAELFGSRAMGTFTPASDVDIALFGENVSLTDEAAISGELEETTIPYKVDLLRYNTITSPALKEHIKKHGRVIYESDGEGASGAIWRPLNCKEEANIYGKLPPKWNLINISNLIELGKANLQTGPFGTMLHASAYCDYGTPVVAVKNIGDNRLIYNEIPLVDAETTNRLSRYVLKNGDIIFGRKGAVERRAFVHSEEGWIQGSDCIRLRILDNSTVNAKYISFVLGSPHYRNWIIQNAHGATMPSLNQEILGRIPIPLPPIEEQRAIASILGSLDDKIELNRRMNQTLEAMARAIFKSWFVDFDPVRAKAEGRDTGLPPHIADLFPDSFEDSELGEIPKGWEASKVGQHFHLTMGQSPPGSTYNEIGEGLPFYQGRTDFGYRYPSRRIFCTSPTRFAEPSDTLVSVRAPVGDVNMASERCAVGRGVAAIRHNSGGRSVTYYLMHHLGEHFNKFEGEGTVFGCINKKDFERLPFVAPSLEVLTAYDRAVSPLDDRIETNERQSATLTSLRDALLPKLISGELRVSHADQANRRYL